MADKANLSIDLDTIDSLMLNKKAKLIKLHTTHNNGNYKGDEQDPIPYYSLFEINGKLFIKAKESDRFLSRVVKIDNVKNNEYSTRLELFTIGNKGYAKNIMEDCVATEYIKLNHYIKKFNLLETKNENTPLLLARNPVYKHKTDKTQSTLKDFESENNENNEKSLKSPNRPKTETILDDFQNEPIIEKNFDNIKGVFGNEKPAGIFASNMGIDSKGNIETENKAFADFENFKDFDDINNDTNNTNGNETISTQTPDLNENSTDFDPDENYFEDDNFKIPSQNNQINATKNNEVGTTNEQPKNQNLTPENKLSPKSQETSTPQNETKKDQEKEPEQEKPAQESKPESPKPEKKKLNLWKNVFKDMTLVGLQYVPTIVLVLCLAGVFAPVLAGILAIGAVLAFAFRENIAQKIEDWIKSISESFNKGKEASKSKTKLNEKDIDNAIEKQKNNPDKVLSSENNKSKTKRRFLFGKKKEPKGIEIDYSPADVAVAPYVKEYGDKPFTPIKDKGFGNELSEEEIARQEKIINANKSEPLMPKNVLPKTKIREEGIDYGTPSFDLDKQTPVKEVKEKDINLPKNKEMKCFEEEDIELEEQKQPKTEEQERKEIREKTRELHYGEQLPLNEQHKLYGEKIAIKDNVLDSPLPPKPPARPKEIDHSK